MKPLLNPSGGDVFQRNTDVLPLGSKLMERIVSSENVRQAWKQVKSNKGVAGIDKIPLDAFIDWAKEEWDTIRTSLLQGRYHPKPVRHVAIPKKSGGLRNLGIPTVLDRLIQQSLQQILTPLFDPYFSEQSYGFRYGRSAHEAIRRVQELVIAGYSWVVDLDIEKFFDRVNHDSLLSRVSRKVSDKRVLQLIGRYLRAGQMKGGIVQPTNVGTPQGGPLSPLLANILLDDLDKEIESRGLNFVRYADDILVLVKSKRAGERVMQSLTRFIERKLKLTINREKSCVVPIGECVYLGFTFKGKKIRWSENAYQAFKSRVRKLTRRSWAIAMTDQLRKLTLYIRGWFNYYGISQYYKPIPELDSWIRRRVRMCYLKQWPKLKTLFKNLLKRGVPIDTAKRTIFMPASWWAKAGVLAVQQALPNKYLDEQGLISVKELWIKIHYPK